MLIRKKLQKFKIRKHRWNRTKLFSSWTRNTCINYTYNDLTVAANTLAQLRHSAWTTALSVNWSPAACPTITLVRTACDETDTKYGTCSSVAEQILCTNSARSCEYPTDDNPNDWRLSGDYPLIQQAHRSPSESTLSTTYLARRQRCQTAEDRLKITSCPTLGAIVNW